MASNLREIWERRRKRTIALREAVTAVRAGSGGQSRQRVRELLEARVAGLMLSPPVSDEAIDIMTDSIMARVGPVETTRLAAQAVAENFFSPFRVFGDVRSKQGPDDTDMILDGEPIIVTFDRALPPFHVQLDLGVQEWLSEVSDRQGFSPEARSRDIFVLLGSSEEQTSDTVAVSVGNRRLGELNHADSSSFERFLILGIEQRKPVLAYALQELDLSGLWQILVYQPSDGNLQAVRRCSVASP